MEKEAALPFILPRALVFGKKNSADSWLRGLFLKSSNKPH